MAEQARQSVSQTSDARQDVPITRRAGESGQGLAQQQEGGKAIFEGRSPFSVVRRMMEDMDRLFENFDSARSLLPALQGSLLPALQGRRQGWSLGTWMPEVEVSERDGKLLVSADLPGMRQEDIDLELRDDALILRGQRNEEREEQRSNVSYSERSYGSFVRTIALPTGVKPDDVEATFQNGVLQVALPLPQESSRRRIEIRGGGAAQEARNLTSGAAEPTAQEKGKHN